MGQGQYFTMEMLGWFFRPSDLSLPRAHLDYRYYTTAQPAGFVSPIMWFRQPTGTINDVDHTLGISYSYEVVRI